MRPTKTMAGQFPDIRARFRAWGVHIISGQAGDKSRTYRDLLASNEGLPISRHFCGLGRR